MWKAFSTEGTVRMVMYKQSRLRQTGLEQQSNESGGVVYFPNVNKGAIKERTEGF